MYPHFLGSSSDKRGGKDGKKLLLLFRHYRRYHFSCPLALCCANNRSGHNGTVGLLTRGIPDARSDASDGGAGKLVTSPFGQIRTSTNVKRPVARAAIKEKRTNEERVL